MVFNINLAGSIPDPAAIEHAIQAVNPSALVDLDSADQITSLETPE